MNKPTENRIRALADSVRSAAPAAGQPCLVAVDGRSGTGKSTIAAALCRYLDCALVAGDDFFAGGVEIHTANAERLADICIDRIRLRQVLVRLKGNRDARFFPFDWDAFDGSLSKTPVEIGPQPVVIVEGVYSFHPDLRDLFDLSVLVCLNERERRQRLHRREGVLGPWELQWHRAEDWYFSTLAKSEVFDLVIENE